MTTRLIRRLLLCVFAAAMCVGCGGDQDEPQSGGVGEGGTGPSNAIGTVNGFGSVIVDGARWDDRNALIESVVDPLAPPQATTVPLGARVEVGYHRAGLAERISVEPELIAPVSAAVEVGPAFAVLLAAGQRVQVNLDPTRGPPTLYAGFELPSELRVGDVIEVHGTQRFDAQAMQYVIAATRIARRPMLPTGYVRIAGVATNVDRGGRRFRLGGLDVNADAAVLQPATATVAEGTAVVVWSRPAPAGGRLDAAVVRLRDAYRSSAEVEAHESGHVARFDAATRTFRLGGTVVIASQATLQPAGSRLTDDAYVVVSGSRRGNLLTARTIEVNAARGRGVLVDISGTVESYDSVNRFYVRGVRISAGAVVNLVNCAGNRIGNGSFVNVVGVIRGAKVEAIQLQCTVSSIGTVISVTGQALEVAPQDKTFRLVPNAMPARVVQWLPLTLFDGVAPGTLAGKSVEVIGVNDPASGRLIAAYIRAL